MTSHQKYYSDRDLQYVALVFSSKPSDINDTSDFIGLFSSLGYACKLLHSNFTAIIFDTTNNQVDEVILITKNNKLKHVNAYTNLM